MRHHSYFLLLLFIIDGCFPYQNQHKSESGASKESSEDQKSDNSSNKPSQALEDDQKPCKLRDLGNGRKVCVCNSKYCDTIPRPKKPGKSEFLMYSSTKEGLRFHKTRGRFSRNRPSRESSYKIYVNPKNTYQRVYGWGGAFTDSTGINIKSLDEQAQDFLMQSYFSENGIEYNLCRVPIGGTDFSVRNYTYDDSESPDKDLKNFALAPEDHNYKIPFMKQAMTLRKNKIKFFGSSWAAPKWMKTNNKLYGYGFIKKEYFQTWANYFVRFLEEYSNNGIPMWGLTTQNEPSMAILQSKDLPTVGWSSANLSMFIKENLGPTIANSKFNNIVIMALDDQKILLPFYLNSVFEDKNAEKYVQGIAIHWYLGAFTPCSALNLTQKKYPSKFILSTEACSGFQSSSGVLLGSWERGEGYSKDIIENLNCHVVGWVDWNMVLDMTGGPTTIANYVDAPIIVNNKTREFYKQPMYYHIGHHSKFVPENSVRIEVTQRLGRLWITAYQKPDEGIVVVILNKNDRDVSVQIVDKSLGVAALTVSKRSINTILYYYD